MTTKEAGRHVIQFGKFKGQTLDQIAMTDTGLRYLDWARGLENLLPQTRAALDTYLSDPVIEKELRDIL